MQWLWPLYSTILLSAFLQPPNTLCCCWLSAINGLGLYMPLLSPNHLAQQHFLARRKMAAVQLIKLNSHERMYKSLCMDLSEGFKCSDFRCAERSRYGYKIHVSTLCCSKCYGLHCALPMNVLLHHRGQVPLVYLKCMLRQRQKKEHRCILAKLVAVLITN